MRQHHVIVHKRSLPTLAEELAAARALVTSPVGVEPERPASKRRKANAVELRAIFAISRKSSRVDDAAVQRMRTCNIKLREFVQENDHHILHLDEEASSLCKCDCRAQAYSIVINGLSSNADMSTTGQSDATNLRKPSLSLDTEPDASN
jgi:hypothetical protein